ncbi:MAG: tetratricopeptide repeat protein [Gammaproteobacteria bacterium]|nr:tetratricopeptide repeat protein [Gammaproteobacteria bacterium]MBQ0840670.1 tetratricopeptide repeat protein [Gammaproteobacteria bacterium]
MMISLARSLLALCVVTLLLSACDGVEGRKSKYMAQGDQNFEIKDYEKARISYQNVLQIDPKDVAANVRYGETLGKLHEWSKAAAQYRRTLELDPENNLTTTLLARLYLLAQEPDLAIGLADKALVRNPGYSPALSVKAAGLAIKGDADKSRLLAREALDIDPQNNDASILLASLHTQAREYAEAEAVLNAALKHEADNITMMTLLAQIYVFQKQYDAAGEQLKSIASLEPDTYSHRQTIVDFYNHQGQALKAEAYLQAFIDAHPGHVESNIALLKLRLTSGELENVEPALIELILAYPDVVDFRTTLGEVYVSRKEIDKAISCYEDTVEYFAGKPAAITASSRLADLYRGQGNIDKANEILEAVLELNPEDPDALTTRARLALVADQPDAAIADLRTVLKAHPKDIVALALIAESHRRNGEVNLAINYLLQLKTAKPGQISTYLSLSNLYQIQQRTDEAVVVLEQARALSPSNRQILEALAKIYVSQGQWSSVHEVSKALIATEDAVLSGYYFTGIAYQGQGEHDKAVSWFDRALAEQPAAIEPMTAKITSLLVSDRKELALEFLLDHVKKHPDSAYAYNLLGEIELGSKHYSTSEKYLRQAISSNPAWWLPYRTLASLKLKQQKTADAVDILSQGISASDGAVALRQRLALLLTSTGDYEGAISEYEALLSAGERSDSTLNNLAMLLATYRDDAASAQRACTIVNQISDASNPAYLDTIGWIHLRLGENEQALVVLKRAVQSVPGEPLLRFHLGKAYLATNDHAAARAELTRALDSEKDFEGKEEAMALLESLKKSSKG